ncbi:ABC transporter ATP-binding protein [Rossellomorea vietnamensis]|uniref:ABC transporter ATP-binding protein n=1 Tax=Rossellomorea vietnamensis TaxID=218284 RepID=A0A0P6VY19_9BACI|nr:ABC transporter ATP-binding protein [Rossellomorea vietnamensis]KPL57925.1 ABC transporter ATP-binding protein [Rossellomorea vietnamensis]
MNVLEVVSLEKRYKEKLAVENISFQLKSGACTALLGPNGAGKTTTLNMLAGLIKPTAGKIMTPDAPDDIREMIGYLPQYPAFFEWMTGKEYLIFSGEISGMKKGDAESRAGELITLVGLEEGKNRKVGQYSGGMKQRLGIAQALIHNPKLIILDEPVSALDPFGRREVLDLLNTLKKETTILFSTHILNDAEQICEDVLFLHEGVLIEQGAIQEVKARHHNSRLTLYFNENSNKFIPHLMEKDWIHNLIANGNQVSFEVGDLERDRARIFTLISENGWGVTKFDSGEQSLEEVFMEVMKK